jgi:hypothetical protein
VAAKAAAAAECAAGASADLIGALETEQSGEQSL